MLSVLAAPVGIAQQDSSYITDYRDFGNLSLALEQKANTLSLVNRGGDFIQLRTNNGLPQYGIMFSYKWLNAWATTSIGNATYSNPLRGKTDNLGLAVGYTGDHWWMRVFYERYTGFHVANPEAYDPNWFDTQTNYPLLPDLTTHTVYANAYYGFNEETYSHRAFLWQSQAQKKSAGSFLIGVSAGYDRVAADSLIVPSVAIPQFYSIRNISGYETITIGTNIGYTHTWAFNRRWSLGLMFAPGIATSYGRTEELGVPSRELSLDFGAMAEGRFILSYHHERWYGGIAANAYILTKPLGSDFFNNAHTYIRFNVGYRLDMPTMPFLRPFGLSD